MQGRGPILVLPRLNSGKHQTVEVSKSRVAWRSPRCWLGTGQAGRAFCVAIGPALPACTSLPGCPQWTVRPQRWTCQRAPRSPSYEGSGKAERPLQHDSVSLKAFHNPSLTANQQEDLSMRGKIFCWALVYREGVKQDGPLTQGYPHGECLLSKFTAAAPRKEQIEEFKLA